MYLNNMNHHDDHEYIGLNNQICKNPTHYCKIHLVYLSDEDIRIKKCMCKPTFDMIGTTSCKSLMTIEEYEKEMKSHKDNITKINASRKNMGMSSYTRNNKEA